MGVGYTQVVAFNFPSLLFAHPFLKSNAHGSSSACFPWRSSTCWSSASSYDAAGYGRSASSSAAARKLAAASLSSSRKLSISPTRRNASGNASRNALRSTSGNASNAFCSKPQLEKKKKKPFYFADPPKPVGSPNAAASNSKASGTILSSLGLDFLVSGFGTGGSTFASALGLA